MPPLRAPPPASGGRARAGLGWLLLFAAGAAFAVGCGSSRALRGGEPGASDEGVAAYYASRFAGRRTASGERYDPRELTAAHRHLPFGTRVRVVRLDGRGQAVVVRINDRGPYGPGRIIDVSRAAARRLELFGPGTARVRIQVLGRP